MQYARSSIFNFPGTRPWFNPRHIASSGVRASFIAHPRAISTQSNPFISIYGNTSGQRTTTSGAATGNRFGIIGATTFCTAVTTSTLAGFPAVADSQQTLAAILAWNNNSTNFQFIICPTSTSNQSYAISLNSGALSWRTDATSTNSTAIPTPAIGAPYFYAASLSGSVVNYILVNLNTGQTYTDSKAASSSANASTGTYTVGSWGGGTFQALAYIACAMASNSYMSLPKLRMWASDPWSFWYAPQFEVMPNNVGVTVAPTAITDHALLRMGIGM